MDEALAYLLEMRVRVRRNPEGLALVDRCLALVARARTARTEDLPALEAEVARIGDDLALRYGAPAGVPVH